MRWLFNFFNKELFMIDRSKAKPSQAKPSQAKPSQAKPMLRWMGGKSKLAPIIISQFPRHTCYVEAFCGGAAILLKKPPSKAEVINDANGELINLYQCVKYHPEELAKHATGMLHSRWLFDRLKVQNPQHLTDIQRAARFYSLNRMAFGAGMKNPSFGYARSSSAGLTASRFKRDIEMLSARLDKVFIEHLDWLDCIQRYDSNDTLVYCDPPYLETSDYGIAFGVDEYIKMADTSKAMKGRMIISLNDHPTIRDIFSGFSIEELPIKYSRGKVETGQARKQSIELLIKSF
jgi:DNA adenine methylase